MRRRIGPIERAVVIEDATDAHTREEDEARRESLPKLSAVEEKPTANQLQEEERAEHDGGEHLQPHREKIRPFHDRIRSGFPCEEEARADERKYPSDTQVFSAVEMAQANITIPYLRRQGAVGGD